MHDSFRGKQGAFAKALAGIRNSMAAGNKTGIRFTVNKLNFEDLLAILDIVEHERIPRFCLYHLVYAGRGKETEILTIDNHADGIYILHYIEQHFPARKEEVETLLKMHGGCSAGEKMPNVDSQGNIHACQFWGHKLIGNIRKNT